MAFLQDNGEVYFLLVSPPPVVAKVLELAELRPGQTLCDLGCADGRIIIEAACRCGARGIGIESNEQLWERARGQVRAAGLEALIEVIHGDLCQADLSAADVVVLYLDEQHRERAKPKLRQKLSEGGRVISVAGEIRGWRPARSEVTRDGEDTYAVYLYQGQGCLG